MYTLLDCIKHKCRDSYVLYIPTVHTFGSVLLTHTLLVQTHTHDMDKTFKGTVGNQTLPSFYGSLLELTLTVPLHEGRLGIP